MSAGGSAQVAAVASPASRPAAIVAEWLIGTSRDPVLVSIGAEWHFEEAAFATVQRSGYDPLIDPAYAPPMPPISVETSTAELDAYVLDLLNQEAQLFDEGVTCPIKDLRDTTCLACPVSAARDYSEPLGRLCRIGQEQERVATVLVAKRAGLGGERRE